MREDTKLKVRLGLITLFTVLLTGVMFLRLAIIYLKVRPKLKPVASQLALVKRSVEAPRGNIYSERGDLLAGTIPVFEVRFDPFAEVPKRKLTSSTIDSLAACVAKITGQDAPALSLRIKRERTRGNRFILLAKKVNFLQLQQLSQCPVLRLGRYKGGMIVIQKNKRTYPFGKLAVRTLGSVRPGAKPVGVEGFFNEILAGKPGIQMAERIFAGYYIAVEEISSPQPGNDLVVTIDPYIQDIVEGVLEETLIKHRARAGCAILMEVQSGKIKAIANLERLPNGVYWETYNYAVGQLVEPGSIFKTVTLLALMKVAGIRGEDTVNVFNGKYTFYDRVMRDVEGIDSGVITVRKAFYKSSNVGISRLAFSAFGDNPRKFIEALKEMGLHLPTGITLHGEPSPIIKTPDDPTWSGTTLPWMSVGYEVKFTPLQIATFYNAIARGGKRIQPILVTAIKSHDKVVKSFRPEEAPDPIAPERLIKELTQMLKLVVDSGTARLAGNPYFSVAGKTGTAQLAQQSQGYTRRYLASFVGFFPADEPLYTCLVMVWEPQENGYYGGVVAAPAFGEIARRLMSKLHISARLLPVEKILHASTAKSSILHVPTSQASRIVNLFEGIGLKVEEAERGKMLITTAEKDTILVAVHPVVADTQHHNTPRVIGLPIDEAIYILEKSGTQVLIDRVTTGIVKYQFPKPGEPIAKFTVIGA